MCLGIHSQKYSRRWNVDKRYWKKGIFKLNWNFKLYLQTGIAVVLKWNINSKWSIACTEEIWTVPWTNKWSVWNIWKWQVQESSKSPVWWPPLHHVHMIMKRLLSQVIKALFLTETVVFGARLCGLAAIWTFCCQKIHQTKREKIQIDGFHLNLSC